MRGFTLIELLVVIALIVILIGASIPIYTSLQVSAQLNESVDQIMQTMRLARTRAVERFNDAPHGIFFEINQGGAARYTLFQGSSYASRNDA